MSANILGTGAQTQPISVDSAWQVRWWPLGRFVLIGSILGYIVWFHLLKIWKRYNAKKAVAIHTAAVLVELAKFSLEDVFRDPACGKLDLAIASVANASSVALCAALLKGNQAWTRSIFQAGIVMRIGLQLYAYTASAPEAHRAAIYLNHGAVYIRVIIALFQGIVRNYSELYTAATFTAGVIAFESASIETAFLPAGSLFAIYLALIPLIKYCTDLNVDIDYDEPIVIKSQSQLPEPAQVLLELPAANKPADLGDIPHLSLPPLCTDFALHIASPVSPRPLTLSNIEDFNAGQHPADGIEGSCQSGASSSSASSTALSSPSSSDADGLLTPLAEEAPQLKSKPKLAALDTSFASIPKLRSIAERSAPWSALLPSPSSVSPFSAVDRATIKKELRIMAVRAGLSPIKEWQNVRKWDRARKTAAAARRDSPQI